MEGLTPDEIRALADRYPSDVYESRSQQLFALLVDVGKEVYKEYLEEDRPNLDDPNSFIPATMAGVSHGFALVEGFRENLEMAFPDGRFDA